MTPVSRIDLALGRPVEAGEIPGVVAIAADGGKVLYEGAFGKRDLSADREMTLDTVFWLASMTKAPTSVAAMQLVEQGRVGLDEPVAAILPQLAAPMVLEGFVDGAPRMRPARRPITLRHLLTHTAGFGYDIWNADIRRYVEHHGLPDLVTCRNAALTTPMTFDPGERWQYGTSTDWTGKLVEAVSGKTLAAYLHDHLFAPLGMSDTSFRISPSQRARLAVVYQRRPDGSLTATGHEIEQEPEFHMGGGGVYGTARDYVRFAQMFLNDGRAQSGVRVLKPETVALMGQNHVAGLRPGILKTVKPGLSNDTDFFPGIEQHWGLGFLINAANSPHGRHAGSLSWAGLANTYFWIDPARRICGVVMTQIFPFADTSVLKLYETFEGLVYRDLASAAAA